MVNLSQKPLMLSENFLTSESISELGNFYGVASVDMSPDEIWNTGSVWLVWRQTCQTDGVLLMYRTGYAPYPILTTACGHFQSHAVGLQQLITVKVSITLSTAGGSPLAASRRCCSLSSIPPFVCCSRRVPKPSTCVVHRNL